MSSFPASARRVRDTGRAPIRRLYALRECALHFAPYGFRATWHHLIVSARIPRDLDTDPDSLIRAVDELSAARDLVTPLREAYAAARRRDKAAGRRGPVPPDLWVPAWPGFAHCPDPERHPSEPLPVVVRRIIDHRLAGTDPAARCPACATARRHRAATCPVCGVGPVRTRTPADPARWHRIWSRDV